MSYVNVANVGVHGRRGSAAPPDAVLAPIPAVSRCARAAVT